MSSKDNTLVRTALIIDGAATTDDLNVGGVALAQKYEEADAVVLISPEGYTKVVKGNILPDYQVSLVSLKRDNLDLLRETLENMHRIYSEYHNETLAHEAVASWLFHWFWHGRKHIELLNEHDIGKLVKSAEDFIEHDFGMSSRPVLNVDGTEKSDSETETVPSTSC